MSEPPPPSLACLVEAVALTHPPTHPPTHSLTQSPTPRAPAGWDRGVEGMRVGDKRKLTIPPQMAYGSQRVGTIPPNSTLVFDVELVDVR